MKSIWTMGEMLVEIMRPHEEMPHDVAGEYIGPFPSGAPVIFIDAVTRLGGNAGIIGGVGNDGFGKNLLTRLVKDGVDCSHVKCCDSGSTAIAFVMYHADGSREFIFHIAGTPATQGKMPVTPIEDVGFFHIMGCSLTAEEAFCNEIIKTMHQMKEHGAKISFDPNIRPELLKGDIGKIIAPVMENCSVLLPGVDELLMLSGEKTVEAACAKLYENPVLEVIALKRGSKGATIITREDSVNVPACKIRQLDATGAGDCFDGAFLTALLAGKEHASAGAEASAAGALNAMAFGPMEGDISPQTVAEMIAANR